MTGQTPLPPLAGVRILALTQAWAGTLATEQLALMGAEVIQVESRSRPDVWRGGYRAPIPAMLQANQAAHHGWNVSALFNSVNLDKEGITLDLGRPEGIDLVRRLIAQSDVVAENFSPRVMGNLGLDYAALEQLRPGIILLSMSAFGATGPYAFYPGIGGTVEAVSGMCSQLGYPGGPPLNAGLMVPDPISGYFGASAVMLALYHRNRTGQGQHIDLAMQTVCATFLADALMQYSAREEVRPRMGNHHPEFAPHNIYPCAGEDRWLSLATESDAEFERLAAVAGHPEWSHDSRFRTNPLRKQHEDELDTLIAAWTSAHDALDLERELLAAGLLAARVHGPSDVLLNEQLWRRRTLAHVTHPEAGTFAAATTPAHLPGTLLHEVPPAPLLGEHSREVFSRLLQMTEDEYLQLEEQGITGTEPPI